MLTSLIMGCGRDDELISGDYFPIEFGNSCTFIDLEYPMVSSSISVIGTTKLNNGETVFIASTDGNEAGYLSH